MILYEYKILRRINFYECLLYMNINPQGLSYLETSTVIAPTVAPALCKLSHDGPSVQLKNSPWLTSHMPW